MHNESSMSDYSNASIIQPVKQQIYDFVSKSQQLTFQNSENPRFKNAMSMSTRPLRQEQIWKPKIPSKKLFQQPKFLMSLERKKIRVIAGLQSSVMEAGPTKNNQFRSEKIKTNKVQFIRSERNIAKQGSDELFNVQENNQNFHKNFKTPHLNFNLQYLIKKRKTFKSESQEKKQGSNAPYFSFFTSNRFDLTSRHTSETRARKLQTKTAQPFFRSKTRK